MKITKSQLKQIIEEEILNEAMIDIPPFKYTRGLIERINALSDVMDNFDPGGGPAGGVDEATLNELQDAMTTLQASYQQMLSTATSKGQGDIFDVPEPKKKKPFTWKEGKKASKTVGDPPYRERGATESQAQQKAAGMALSARRGDTPVSKLKGAALEMYNDKKFKTKEIRNLAKLGQKVKQHKTKEPKHLKSLPGHATPAKD